MYLDNQLEFFQKYVDMAYAQKLVNIELSC